MFLFFAELLSLGKCLSRESLLFVGYEVLILYHRLAFLKVFIYRILALIDNIYLIYLIIV